MIHISNILTHRNKAFRLPVLLSFTLYLLSFLPSCATLPGVLFPPLPNAPKWPPPPEIVRITYVGQLATSDDLKPGVSGLDALGHALFGKNDIHTMLSPLAVASDNNSRLFVADSNAQCVHVFDLNTRKYATWTPAKDQPPFSQPVGIAWLPSHIAPALAGNSPDPGQLLVSDSVSGCLFVFNSEGKLTSQLGIGILQRPVGIAVDPARQRIFVADAAAHQIIILSLDGRLLQRLGSRGTELGQFNFPTNVALDPQGRLYVSDSLNFRIQLFDADLKPLRQIGQKGDLPGYFAQPKGIATDSEGHLYVLDAQFENVQIFNDLGQILMDFGDEGRGPGQFWLPTAIFIDHAHHLTASPTATDRIYIADSYNRRIQVFDYKSPPQPETQP